MTARKILALFIVPAFAFTAEISAQSYDGNAAAQQLHYYDIADFELQASDINYADHIAPILQRSCLQCHRPGGGGPMSFLSYDEVRPWAPVIMYRTAIRDRMGAMPPWYIEKDIGIADGFESDYSLSDLDLSLIHI